MPIVADMLKYRGYAIYCVASDCIPAIYDKLVKQFCVGGMKVSLSKGYYDADDDDK